MQKSHVWKYFVREAGKARCKVENCNAVLDAKATTSLSYHLEKTHKLFKSSTTTSARNSASTSQGKPNEQDVVEKVPEEPQPKKQKTMFECFWMKTLEETISRMAATDGLTIRQITKSSFIHQSLVKEFPKRSVPKTENGTMVLIEKYYAESKEQVKNKISRLKTEGMKFSMTLDEWTSLKNVRFLNINLHFTIACNESKYFNLGMVKIEGSCPADLMLTLVHTQIEMRH